VATNTNIRGHSINRLRMVTYNNRVRLGIKVKKVSSYLANNKYNIGCYIINNNSAHRRIIMEKKQEKLVIILQESVVGSIIKDAVTFLMFGGLMYFNHKVLDGNGWIDAIFILFVLMWLQGLKSGRAFSGNCEDAIKWLENKG